MPATTDDPSVAGLPRQLGKYTLVRRLATGGMAELFLAIQRSLGGFEKLIVIKRILPAMNHDRGFVDMLLHEARLAATFSHPNIAQVFDVGMVDGAYFIAMEHVHGEDLRAVVRQMKRRNATEFPMEHALSVTLGVCAALAYAHEKRDLAGAALDVVHRDISPQNIVVTFGGDVKLIDFGIAKSSTKAGDDTESGRLKGKVPYMSPEQARGQPIDWRSDLFAAGIILFELTTGRRLFKARSEYETLELICERDVPLPSRVRPGYPPALEAIVMRALARDRNERWQSARAMQAALEDFVRDGRVAANRTGLSQFMRALFAEKLLRHGEALLQEKQLADRVALDDAGATGWAESARVPSFGPTAARITVTDARIGKKGRSGLVLGTLGLLAAVGTATGIALSRAPGKAAQGHAMTPGALAAPGAPNVLNALNTPSAPSALNAPNTARTATTPFTRDRGVIAIATSPPGAAIFVNGELSAATTPVTFTHVAIGTAYDIVLAAPGCNAVSRAVTLSEDDPSGAISVVLPPARPSERN